jgi:hypothetical protein
MAKMVRKYDLGIVGWSFDPREIAKCVNSMTSEKVGYYKHKSHEAACELSSLPNKEKLTRMVSRIMQY